MKLTKVTMIDVHALYINGVLATPSRGLSSRKIGDPAIWSPLIGLHADVDYYHPDDHVVMSMVQEMGQEFPDTLQEFENVLEKVS